MNCGHAHPAPTNYDRAFGLGIAMNTVFVVIEAAAGFATNSLALLSDAGHNLSDVLALGIGWGAVWLNRFPETDHHSYGFRRGSVLAALINAALILVAAAVIGVEAVRRFLHPVSIETGPMMLVAAIGIVINFATAMLFHKGRREDINLQGTWLHMMGDAFVSLGVVCAGLLIRWSGLLWIDSAMSVGIAVILFLSALPLLREAVHLALDAVPQHIDRAAVVAHLRALPGVTDHHSLHIWALGTTDVALTVHLVTDGRAVDLDALRHDLAHHFNIGHATVQVEQGRDMCAHAHAS